MTATPPAVLRARLRVAATDPERDAAIAAWLKETPATVSPDRRAIIAEGVLFDRVGPQNVPLVGLAAGCPCCTGLVALRVVLGRTLRRIRPESLLLLVAAAEHLPRLRRMLEDDELGVSFEVEA